MQITINDYRTYVVLINYDKDLPKKFRNISTHKRK